MEPHRDDAAAVLLSRVRLSPRSLHATVGCENFRVLTDDMTQTFMARDGSCTGGTGAEVLSWLIWDVVVLSCVLSSKKRLDSNSVQDALAYVCIFVIHRDT